MSKARRVAFYGIFAALSVLMGYVERSIPLPIPVPGIKLGLANIVVLLVLYVMGEKEAFFISLVRIAISALLFAGFAGFLYSLAGALFSCLCMTAAKKTGLFSIVTVSIIGGVFHNIGQLLTAIWVVKTPGLVVYLPVLLLAGVITGAVIGTAAAYSLPYIKSEKRG